jgi:hypothetical protein
VFVVQPLFSSVKQDEETDLSPPYMGGEGAECLALLEEAADAMDSNDAKEHRGQHYKTGRVCIECPKGKAACKGLCRRCHLKRPKRLPEASEKLKVGQTRACAAGGGGVV